MAGRQTSGGREIPVHAVTADTDYVVYTDGGCLVNPDGPGGIGVVVHDLRHDVTTEYSAAYACTTNNRMEIRAAIVGLTYIPKGANVLLYSDSQYLVCTAIGRFRETRNTDLWPLLHQAEAGKTVHYNWVRGHVGNRDNERCDELAGLAMRTLNRQVDEGYAEQKKLSAQEKQPKGPATSGTRKATAQVPAHLDVPPDVTNVDAYAQKYLVKQACAQDICRFYRNTGRGMDAYGRIHTDGVDSWSRKSEAVLREVCGEETLRIARSHFRDDREYMTCLRWRCRGLTLSDAIRKVEVDREIARRAMR
ncbi:MAG: ribonuclease HI [Clostridia bacterium]|nr:ribonuclease HI [Clostridia bacterium]MBR2286973.1 ribonuclease HI [Clostridia bacterium]